MKSWYKIESKADKAEIWIYEYIGEDFWTGDGLTAKKFQKEISAIKASQIDLHINSPGGSVFDGITIYNLIKQHPANVTSYIDGIAASIASVIALAGNKVIMAGNALFMIHGPSGGVFGTSNDMRSFADVLDKIGSSMVTTYVNKTAKSEEDIQAMLEAETWMTADEALLYGFVDEISEELDMAACARFIPVMARAGFKHIPEALNAIRQIPSERDIERILRDAGCSAKQAKTILAKGYPANLRDGDIDPVVPTVVDVQRDAEDAKPVKMDRVADLLVRAEIIAPAT